jgi:hypothetical protein
MWVDVAMQNVCIEDVFLKGFHYLPLVSSASINPI